MSPENSFGNCSTIKNETACNAPFFYGRELYHKAKIAIRKGNAAIPNNT